MLKMAAEGSSVRSKGGSVGNVSERGSVREMKRQRDTESERWWVLLQPLCAKSNVPRHLCAVADLPVPVPVLPGSAD